MQTGLIPMHFFPHTRSDLHVGSVPGSGKVKQPQFTQLGEVGGAGGVV